MWKKYTDIDIRTSLLNNRTLHERFRRSLEDLIAHTRKLLYDKIATYPVSPDIVESTTDLLLRHCSDKDIQDMLNPWSEKLDDILRTQFSKEFFQ